MFLDDGHDDGQCSHDIFHDSSHHACAQFWITAVVADRASSCSGYNFDKLTSQLVEPALSRQMQDKLLIA